MAVVSAPFHGDFQISQAFGVNPQIYARFKVPAPGGGWEPMASHSGIDFALPDGTPLYAPDSGALYVGHDPTGYGNYVKILTGRGEGEDEGESWLLGHMGRIDVADGTMVESGQYVGLSNNSGFSTGPHTHCEYHPPNQDRTNGWNGAIDPAPILAGSAYPNVASPVTGLPDTSNTLPYDPNNPPDYSFQPPDVTHSPFALAGGALLLLVVAASVADN